MSSRMEYVPRIKQQPQDTCKEDPTQVLLRRQFNKNLSIGSSSSRFNSYTNNGRHNRHNEKFVYGNKSTRMWFSAGLVNDYRIPSSITLKEISVPYTLPKGNKVLLILVKSGEEKFSRDELRLKSPWTSIAGNVLEDVLSSFQNLENEFNFQNFDELNPGFVVRFGKILFHGSPSFNPHRAKKRTVSENALRLLQRTFYTTVPPSYMENIVTHVVPEIGFGTKVEKESYRVKLSDSENLDATIVCECKVTPDGKRIELYKIEMNQVRHLVVDVSCFGKNLDMRLMLRTRRISSVLSDKEMQSIRHLISSAILDLNVKGWLRWPKGKTCHAQRYRVTGVWHSKCTTYKNSSMRLRMRDVDRYEYQSSTEEFAREVVLKLTEIGSKLKGPTVEDSSLMDTLKDYLKIIWEHFLDCDEFLESDQIIS